MRKIGKLLAVFLLVTFLSGRVFAQSDSDKLRELNEKIAEYETMIGNLQNQANTLSNQIAQYNAQIALTELKISQTNEQINLLGGRIDQLEISLGDLEEAFNTRALETYKMARTGNSAFYLFEADGISDMLSRIFYLQKIQEADRSLLTRLKDAQEAYIEQKGDLEKLEKVLGEQKIELNSQKAAKDQLLAQTKNDEENYQDLLASAKAELAAFKRFTIVQGGASILSGQTKCDSWGCYYNQRDGEWGNLGLGGSSYSAAEYGCLVTSVSMMASHMGRNIKPIDIATSAAAFVPGTGYLYHDFTVNGVHVTLSSVSKSQLDSELAAGRPVIAGLYSGPDHFIVILRKEGDQYIMHDPFLENGSARSLTDKYSVDVISSLRLVSFN